MSSGLAFSSGIAQPAALQANSGFLSVLLAVGLAAGLPSCRTLEKAGAGTDPSAADPAVEASTPANPVLPIGVVQHVDEVARFILIRSSRGFQIEPGTILTVHGNQSEPTATVKVSPARKGAILTADFVEGAPKAGQTVTMVYAPAGASGSLPVAPIGTVSDLQVLE